MSPTSRGGSNSVFIVGDLHWPLGPVPGTRYRVLATRFSILIKAPAAFPPQPSRIHHLDEQRARPELRITQPLLHHPHDVETNIEPDKIRERQRPHGMRHAQLEHLV